MQNRIRQNNCFAFLIIAGLFSLQAKTEIQFLMNYQTPTTTTVEHIQKAKTAKNSTVQVHTIDMIRIIDALFALIIPGL